MQITGRAGAQGQGPFMVLHLECEDGQVTACSFETYGCPSAIRCGDWVARWAVGRALSSLRVLGAEDLLLVVGGLPLGKEFCAQMTVDALSEAVAQAP